MPKQKNSNIKSKAPFDFILFITVLILLAMGIVMVLSASAPSALADGDSYYYVSRQAIFAVLGIVLMIIISNIDYKIYAKFAKVAYLGSVAILAIVPIIGSSSKGATRWINLGFVSFQPSEIAKVALIIFFAAWLTKNKDRLKTIKHGFIVPFIYLAPIALILVFFQNHLSVTIIIILVVSIMMLMAGTKLRYFLTMGTIGAVGGAGVLYLVAKATGEGLFRLKRITTFLNPWEDIKGDSWQIIQSLYAIGSGGLFGAGLGESKQKFLYISEPHNDFIFSVLAEELGFIGCVIVILLFAIFIWRGLVIAMKAPDMFGSLIAVRNNFISGITSYNEYSSCYIINAKYRYTTTIL